MYAEKTSAHHKHDVTASANIYETVMGTKLKQNMESKGYTTSE